MSPPDAPAPAGPILLFDGVCTLCDASVQFVMRHEAAGRVRFASLQSAAAQPWLARAGLDPHYLDSLVFVDEAGRVLAGADAALAVGARLDAPWRVLAHVGRWLPRGVREAAYRFVARYRYRVFGRKDACRIPTPAERARFLPDGV